MEVLPRELIDEVLRFCVAIGPKNAVLNLRLVCKSFDAFVKPFVLQTLSLEFSRLSKASQRPRPRIDALQTIGYHCKSMYIDLQVLRDDFEVAFLEAVVALAPSMADFCRTLKRRYSMNHNTFTPEEYLVVITDMLFSCRDVDSLRINLPFQLIGRRCDAATMILANTFKALAHRPEEDSAKLKTLVLENVTDITLCNMWMNPVDVQNIVDSFMELEHLVMTVRRHYTERNNFDPFHMCLWEVIQTAGKLKSLCLVGLLDQDDRLPFNVRQTRATEMTPSQLEARILMHPHLELQLTSLELKRVEVHPRFFYGLCNGCGSTLQELYLNEVVLVTEQGSNDDDMDRNLWVGLPNRQPTDVDAWIATELRLGLPKLSICRAAVLSYHEYITEQALAGQLTPGLHPEFDLMDPCGLGRSVAQRFVEVVQGIQQPGDLASQPVAYLQRESDERTLPPLKSRAQCMSVVDYDINAYQKFVENTTSAWYRSIDGLYPNRNKGTLEELQRIAEAASRGLNEVHNQRRRLWPAPNDDELGASVRLEVVSVQEESMIFHRAIRARRQVRGDTDDWWLGDEWYGDEWPGGDDDPGA